MDQVEMEVMVGLKVEMGEMEVWGEQEVVWVVMGVMVVLEEVMVEMEELVVTIKQELVVMEVMVEKEVMENK